MEGEAFDKFLLDNFPDVRPTSNDAMFARLFWEGALAWSLTKETELADHTRKEIENSQFL